MKFASIVFYCSTFLGVFWETILSFWALPIKIVNAKKLLQVFAIFLNAFSILIGSGYSPFRCRFSLLTSLRWPLRVATIPSALMRKNIIVVWNHFELWTGRHFAATPAGFHVVFYGTFSDFTKRITERSFYAIHTATFTINHFRQNFHLIQFWPFICNFFTKFVVIVYSCKTSFAGFAV